MSERLNRRALLAALLFGCAAVAAAAQPMWQAGAGFFISSGDYGTDSDITTTYLPFSFGRVYTRGKLDLVIPYLSVTSASNVTVIGGSVQRRGRTTARTERTTQSGLGDMLLRARWQAVQEDTAGWIPEMTLVAKIKFPTANEDDGLGTGEFDETVGAEFWKTLRHSWSALLDLSYVFTGNPPGEELRDIWRFALGAGYEFKQNLLGTVAYEESRALVSGNSNPRDLVFGVSFLPKETVQLSGTLSFGLSDGSPDIGLGANAALKFERFK